MAAAVEEKTTVPAKADLGSLTSMLQARWKGGSGSTPPGSSASRPEPVKAGQVRSFRIARLDGEAKRIEVELV